MTISIGFRIEFYDPATNEYTGAAWIENSHNATAVPREGERVSIAYLTKADQAGLWWPGSEANERVHHLEHYPVLNTRDEQPGIQVILHTTAPSPAQAPALARELRRTGWELSAATEDSPLARALANARKT